MKISSAYPSVLGPWRDRAERRVVRRVSRCRNEHVDRRAFSAEHVPRFDARLGVLAHRQYSAWDPASRLSQRVGVADRILWRRAGRPRVGSRGTDPLARELARSRNGWHCGGRCDNGGGRQTEAVVEEMRSQIPSTKSETNPKFEAGMSKRRAVVAETT